MTQKDLAKLLNINPSNFPNYESGKYSPSIDMLVKLADYFNVSLDSLVRDKDADEWLTIKDAGLIQLTKKVDQLDEKNKVTYIGTSCATYSLKYRSLLGKVSTFSSYSLFSI